MKYLESGVYFTITAHLDLYQKCAKFSLEIFDLYLAFIKFIAEKVHLRTQIKQAESFPKMK